MPFISGMTPTPAQLAYRDRGMTEETKHIIDLWNSGLNIKQIAEKVGKKYGAVQRALFLARKNGVSMRDRRFPDYSRATLLGNRTKGTFHDILCHLSPEAIVWLGRNTPKDATVAQTISAILTDAYFEDQEAMNKPRKAG